MNWIPLTEMSQLDAIDLASEDQLQIIFKHSTRCNISADTYDELETADTEAYYLDLLRYRDISDEIAHRYGVLHKSPQVLVISKGVCIFNESHWRIRASVLRAHLQNA
ncbi:hypothetical protein D3C71_243870 [compost metagenome]